MRKKLLKTFLVMAALSVGVGFSEAETDLPELPPPQFDLGSEQKEAPRVPANEDDAKDLLSELEGLLESPAQKDARKQLAQPEVVIEPIPQIKLDPPVSSKKAEKPAPAAKKVAVTPKPKVTPEATPKSIAKPILKAPIKRVAKAPKKKVTPKLNNEVTALDFAKVGENFVLTVMSKSQLKYRMEKEESASQFVYSFENTTAPRNLRRAYDTKEFSAPLALYTLTQIQQKKGPLVKLFLKMRELKIPKMIQSDNRLVFEFPIESPAVSKRIIAAELPEMVLGDDAFDGGKNYKGAIIQKLELKDTEVQEAIRLVARSSGYNIVINDDVKGTIGSLSVENVPWDQAFHLILQMKKLGFIRRGNLVRVASLDTLKAELEAIAKQEELAPIKTAIIPVSYAKAQTIAARARAFLTGKGKVEVDERTNTLIIRDTESTIAKIQKLFAVLDTQPPSVAISAKFVQVKKSFSRTLGLGEMNMAGQTSGLNFGSPATAFAGPGLSAGPTSGAINLSARRFAAINARLSLGETEDQSQTLSNPTIVVQQGQAGNITQGKTINVAQAAVGQGTVTTPLVVNANLTLTVTPVVANDGSITLDTNISEISAEPVAGNTITTQNRALTTQIILQNGDTAVLGGVLAGSETESSGGIPFLRDLPVIGYLFGQRLKTKEQNEVLVFLTARILNPESAFKQNL